MASPGTSGHLSGRDGVEIVTIGTELLLGATLEGNGTWLSHRLGEVGIKVHRRVTVGDDVHAIAAAIAHGLERHGAVICTGGLGPTRDDVTRNAVARVFGRELVLDEGWLEVIRRRFQDRGLDMPAVNRTQAELPAGATLLPNERGTAPGIALEDERLGLVILLPGVPREMQWLTEQHVLPLLRARGFGRAAPVISRTLRTTGISESALAERIEDVVDSFAPLTLAYLPAGTGEDLRLTCWGDLSPDEAARALDRAEAALRERLGDLVYGAGDDDLAEIVLRDLRARRLTLAVAESCTGGLVAKRLTDPAGASDVFLAGIVAYSNVAKRLFLDVQESTLLEHGAVSESVASEMAAGVCRRTGAPCGIAITGIAGPAGGTSDKPVGTVCIATHVCGETRARTLKLPGVRAEVRERSAQAALAWLRKRVLTERP